MTPGFNGPYKGRKLDTRIPGAGRGLYACAFCPRRFDTFEAAAAHERAKHEDALRARLQEAGLVDGEETRQ